MLRLRVSEVLQCVLQVTSKLISPACRPRPTAHLCRDKSQLYIVTPWCDRGNLLHHFVDDEGIGEDKARMWFRQILFALGFMHGKVKWATRARGLKHTTDKSVIDASDGLCFRVELAL